MQPRKAVVYCRVSGDRQVKEGNGLEGQEATCRLYAKHQHIDVIAVFTDGGYTGGVFEREGMQSLLDFVKHYNKSQSQPIDMFLCEDIDRLARGITVHYQIKEEMAKRGMQFVTTKMTFEQTAIGNYQEGMMALNAQYRREHNRERVIDRQSRRLDDGYWTRGVGTGYVYTDAPNGGKTLIRQEPQATIIADGMEKFATGQLATLQNVAKYWEKRGLITKKMGKAKKQRRKIHTSTVSRMLKSTLYAGYIDIDLQTKDKKTGILKHHRKHPLKKAQHQGIISLTTYQKIQDRLNAKNQPNKNGVQIEHPDFPLRGYLECEISGLPLTGGYSKGRNETYPYYRFNHKSELKGKSIRAEKIHHEFEMLLKSMKPNKQFAKLLGMMIQGYLDKEQQHLHDLRKRTDERLKKCKEEQEVCFEYLRKLEEPIVIKRMEEKLRELHEEITILEEQKTEAIPKVDKEKIKKGLALFLNPEKIWGEASFEKKRRLLSLWFKKKIKIKKTVPHVLNRPKSSLYAVSEVFAKNDLQVVDVLQSILNQQDLTVHQVIVELEHWYEAVYEPPEPVYIGKAVNKYVRNESKNSE